MSKVLRQLQDLSIPYPNKLLLQVELEDHFAACGEEQDAQITESEIEEFSSIHNTNFYKATRRLSQTVRITLEHLILLTPITGLIFYLTKEDFMINFIYEGGVPMYPILLLGGILFYRELMLFFKTIIIKDHSSKNLVIDTNSVFIGSLALIASGVGASALGLYFTANGVASNKLPIEIFFFGLKESLGGIILGSTMAAIILVVHFTTRRLLFSWKAPISN